MHTTYIHTCTSRSYIHVLIYMYILIYTNILYIGRVAQLAVVGYLVPELIGKFPGSVGYPGMEVNFADIPNGVDALTVLPSFGSFQIAASIGFWELFGWKETGDSIGDFGLGAQVLYTNACIHTFIHIFILTRKCTSVYVHTYT